MKKEWHVITVEISNGSIDEASAVLFSLGSQGAEEKPAQDTSHTLLLSYFDSGAAKSEDIIASIEKNFKECSIELFGRPTAHTSELRDWSENWKQWFEPFELVKGITVAPTWKMDGIDPKKAIIMDPKMAFGTGLHPTTQLCAEQIYRLHAAGAHGSLIDIGSGSGILAMLATRLEFSPVTAVENDPDALSCARENFAFNHTQKIQSFDELEQVNATFDFIVANILLITLCQLKEAILKVSHPNSTFVLSGITHDQEQDLINAYASHAKLVSVERSGEWSVVRMNRK